MAAGVAAVRRTLAGPVAAVVMAVLWAANRAAWVGSQRGQAVHRARVAATAVITEAEEVAAAATMVAVVAVRAVVF